MSEPERKLSYVMKDSFLPSYGHCKCLDDYDPTIRTKFYTQEQMIVFIVSPTVSSNLKLTFSPESMITIGPSASHPGHFQSIYLEVEQQVHNSHIFDGDSCTDYHAINSSYSECIMNELSNMFIAEYECLPPWFPTQVISIKQILILKSHAHVTF